jgi:hypothetical protein
MLIAFVILLVGLTEGCAVIPVPASVTQTKEVQAVSDGIALAVLFSRDFAPGTPKQLGEEMVECVTRAISTAAPDIKIIAEEEFYRTVFNSKPGEIMLRAENMPVLFTQKEVVDRAQQSRITHLILVGGDTERQKWDGFLFGGGTVVGFLHQNRNTRLTASIFQLTSGVSSGEVVATADGKQGMAIAFPVILGWAHATESSACDALGAEIAVAIRGKAP